MKLNDWTVVRKKSGIHNYIYEYDEMDKEEKEDMIEPGDIIIEETDWEADDYLEIFAAICEDNNAHGMASHISSDLKAGLVEAGIGLRNGEAGTIFAEKFVKDYIKNARWEY